MPSDINFGLFHCFSVAIVCFAIGCKDTDVHRSQQVRELDHVLASSKPEEKKPDIPANPVSITIKFSSRKVKPIAWDGNQFTYSTYTGSQRDIEASVVEVELLKISPSISREDDVAILNLKGGSVVPGLSNATTIRLEYDRDQMELGKFKKGDTWIITFTNAGELVAMRKVIEL